jgi:hypothetical protein
MAEWLQAKVCKTLYVGSIPTSVSWSVPPQKVILFNPLALTSERLGCGNSKFPPTGAVNVRCISVVV